ncbi:MAG TPA: GIY-YIG nuclease family protein [Candidatus Acidoferrales bacterium]|nr:GIY-YIG nuclease family protein [Candidatus Acidoferrales bacterium]
MGVQVPPGAPLTLMFTAYVLRSKTTHRFYTGSTSDLPRRLDQHNANEGASTKNRGPWELVLREDFETLAEGVRRESLLKTGKGREEIKRIFGGNRVQ